MLREYIYYAMQNDYELPNGSGVGVDEPFADHIAAFLSTKGYTVKRNIGTSAYKIDIAVEKPGHPEVLIAGIECDGHNYTNTRTARDRDVLRRIIMTDLGWRLYHVWSMAWYLNPEEEKRRLLDFLRECESAEIKKQAVGAEQGSKIEQEPKHNELIDFESLTDSVDLLRKILGEKCIFNLYGDINQALLPEKCIMDWEDLNEVIGDKVFILNEDYRNTLQITEYCNKEFYAEIYPIGIKGEPVSEMPATQAIRWLVDLKKKNPEYRTSVIVNRVKDSIRATICESINEQEVSWYKVDDKKLSVLTVENAKGLEFEAVVVLCDGMEINEQYIAYTRALDHLCVVK